MCGKPRRFLEASHTVQDHLPKTNRYWFTTSAVAFLAFLLLMILSLSVQGVSLDEIQAFIGGAGAIFFLLILSLIGTVGLVFGGAADAKDRGGSSGRSFSLGCLGALIPLFALTFGVGDQLLIKGFYIMLGCCTGLELAALFEEKPTGATPVVPLAVVTLGSALSGQNPVQFLTAAGLLLLQQLVFTALRHKKKDLESDDSPLQDRL